MSVVNKAEGVLERGSDALVGKLRASRRTWAILCGVIFVGFVLCSVCHGVKEDKPVSGAVGHEVAPSE